MALYDASGIELIKAYNAAGSGQNMAYDANGNVVFSSPVLTFLHSIDMSEFNAQKTVSPQGMAINDGKIFQYFTEDDSIRIIRISDWTILGSYKISEFVHGNGLFFGNIVQESGCPLLYASQFGESASEESRLITIADVGLSSYDIKGYYSIPNSAGYHPQFVADWSNGKAYTVGYANLYTTSGDMIISEYDTSDMTTIIDYWNIPYMGVVQGTTFWNGYIVVIGDSYNYSNVRVSFINVTTHEVTEYSFVKKQSSSMEFQGVDVYDGDLIVSSWIYDDEDNRKLKYWLYTISLP